MNLSPRQSSWTWAMYMYVFLSYQNVLWKWEYESKFRKGAKCILHNIILIDINDEKTHKICQLALISLFLLSFSGCTSNECHMYKKSEIWLDDIFSFIVGGLFGTVNIFEIIKCVRFNQHVSCDYSHLDLCKIWITEFSLILSIFVTIQVYRSLYWKLSSYTYVQYHHNIRWEPERHYLCHCWKPKGR